MEIRQAYRGDLEEIMAVLEAAKGIMRTSGNHGQWVDGYPHIHGIFSAIIDWCFAHDRNIRIDTHRDNLIMQHNLLKHGFTYCGIIYLASGSPRLAYQRL